MENMNLFSGNDITNSQNEKLSTISITGIYERIKSDQQYRDQIDRLRKIKHLDMTAFENVKKRLPFFCGSKFANNLRKSENFIYTCHFVVDIDKVGRQDDLCSIRENLKSDSRIKMMFVSPGGNGLKILMELSSECTSLKKYSDFYKTFVYQFAKVHQIENYIDYSTSDATRVCFFSSDPDIYYNQFSEPININDYLPQELDFKVNENKAVESGKSQIPNDEIYKSILSKLGNQPVPVKREKQYIVPEILNTIIEPLRNMVQEMGISIKEVKDINYGKKIIFGLGYSSAEINIFYGSKGFSVVKTPKNGSDHKLADSAELIIRAFLSRSPTLSVQNELGNKALQLN